MFPLKNNVRSIVSLIQDYQRYLSNTRSFIHELEVEGCDTRDLRKDADEIEAKIRELQMKCGFMF